MGGLVSCKNIWLPLSPPPTLAALYPLALPINASITPHRHAEDTRRATDAAPPRVTFPLNARRPIVLNVIISNVLLPQHWKHALSAQPTGGSASSGRSCYGDSSVLHSNDWDDRPLNSTRTSFRGHLILDRKTKTYNTFHFNGNEMSGLYVKAVTFAYCFLIFYCVYSISSNLYGPLLTLVVIQETICPPNTFCSWNLKTLFFISALIWSFCEYWNDTWRI